MAKKDITNILIGALMLAFTQLALSSSDVEKKEPSEATPAIPSLAKYASGDARSIDEEPEELRAVCGEDIFH